MPSKAVCSDLLLIVELDNGKITVLHIEIQGKGSETPIADYTSNIIRQEKLNSGGVVIYVGIGAGAYDSGDYSLTCPLGVALLALIGQTKINNNTPRSHQKNPNLSNNR